MGWGEGPWPGTEYMGHNAAYETTYCLGCGRDGGSVRRGTPAEYCRGCQERRGVDIVYLDPAAEAWQVDRAREDADVIVGDYAVWASPRPRRGVTRATGSGLPVVFVAVPAGEPAPKVEPAPRMLRPNSLSSPSIRALRHPTVGEYDHEDSSGESSQTHLQRYAKENQ